MPTDELLSGRGGLILFVRYLRGIGIFPHPERPFGSIRGSRKGLAVSEIFKQVLCFFEDGTSRHIVYFDHLKEDAGYAQTIETNPEEMLSSLPEADKPCCQKVFQVLLVAEDFPVPKAFAEALPVEAQH